MRCPHILITSSHLSTSFSLGSGRHNSTIYLIADNKAWASLSFCSPPTRPYTLKYKKKKTSIHLSSYQRESRLTPTHSTCSARPHCHCYSLTRTSFYPVQTTPRSPPDPQRSVSDVANAVLIILLPVGPANMILKPPANINCLFLPPSLILH